MIKYSILIPNLGYSVFFEKCLLSIAKQKNLNNFSFEIIIYDQSDDSDYNRIKRYIEFIKVPNCKLVHSNVKSLVNARHSLLESSTGDYVLFVDSDDFVNEDYLLSIDNSLMKNNDPDILICGFNIVDESNNILEINKPTQSKRIVDDFYYGAEYTSLWRKTFKRSLYNKDNYTDFKTVFGDDWILSKGLFDNAKSIIIDSDLCSYNYRLNSNSITHSFSIERAKESITHRDPYLLPPTDIRQKECLSRSKFRQYIYVSKILISQNGINRKQFVSFSKEIHSSFKGIFVSFSYDSKGEKVLYFCFKERMYSFVFVILKIINRKNERQNKTNESR